MNQRLDALIRRSVEKYDCEGFLNLLNPDIANDTIIGGQNALHIFMCHPSTVQINPDTAARIKVIKQLLEWKVDINARDHSGETPLYLAVANLDVAIIPFLLANGADRRIEMIHPFIDGITSATSLAGYLEFRCKEISTGEEIPMTEIFILNGAKIEEFFGNAPEIRMFPKYPIMLKFYECILRARQISTILIGLHRYKKSPLFSICGKDCITLIARAVYETRGDSIWSCPTSEKP